MSESTITILVYVYLVGLALYTLLQLASGNFGGVAKVTIKWLGGRVFYIPSMYGATGMSLLWFIVLPVQIHQYQMERVRFYRARAERRAREGAATGGAWIKIGNESEGL